MCNRGFAKFINDHPKTFSRRAKRGIPDIYRWEIWKILTNSHLIISYNEKIDSKVIKKFFVNSYLTRDQFAKVELDKNVEKNESFNSEKINDEKSNSDFNDSRISFERFVKNSNELTSSTFEKFIEYYKDKTYQETFEILTKTNPDYGTLIKIDLSRTFPEIKSFDKSAETKLERILNAYANFAPSVGYCQGMNFLCATLINLATSYDFYISETEIFFVFAGMMAKLKMDYLFRAHFPLLMYLEKTFDKQLALTIPQLSNYFKKEGVQSAAFIYQWYLTLFVSFLPYSTVLVLWDNLLSRNISALISITLGLLSMIENHLYKLKFEGILKFFSILKTSTLASSKKFSYLINKKSTKFEDFEFNFDSEKEMYSIY